MRHVNESSCPLPESDAGDAQRLSLLRSCWSAPVVMGVLVFVGVCTARGPYQAWVEAIGIELPPGTVLSLHAIVPSIVGVLTCMTVVARHVMTTERSRNLLDCASLILLGSVGAYYTVALLLPLATVDWFLS